MNHEAVHLQEVRKQIEIEKEKLLVFGENGIKKAQATLDTWNELRQRPLEAALLVICGGIFIALSLDIDLDRPPRA